MIVSFVQQRFIRRRSFRIVDKKTIALIRDACLFQIQQLSFISSYKNSFLLFNRQNPTKASWSRQAKTTLHANSRASFRSEKVVRSEGLISRHDHRTMRKRIKYQSHDDGSKEITPRTPSDPLHLPFGDRLRRKAKG